MEEDIRDVITCFKFGEYRFRGLASAEGQILPFPIDFDGRPYNTLTLPCERVILDTYNDTFELTHLPEGRKVVGGRWVYTVKLGPNDEEQFKARYVAKGYSQVLDIHYHETFSPTARVTSIRMLIQLAAQYDLTVHQMDVKTAYLNAPIDCELYVEQPEGFVTMGENGEKLVLKLKKIFVWPKTEWPKL